MASSNAWAPEIVIASVANSTTVLAIVPVKVRIHGVVECLGAGDRHLQRRQQHDGARDRSGHGSVSHECPPSNKSCGSRRYFAVRLKYFRSGGGWFFRVGI